MTPDNAFLHLPELQGRLTPAHASGLRLTDEVLAEWDAQARCQGLPAHWRLPDHKVEQSRREVQALVLVANTAHTHYRGDLSLQATAATIATACGRIGSNRDYLEQLVQQCKVLGIEDAYVRELAALVDAACGRSR